MKGLPYKAYVLLWVLLLSGCQPYPDHGEVFSHSHKVQVDFGKRRELKLVKVRVNEESLLLEFNQPISELGDTTPAPFDISFQPRIPGAKASRSGCASVLVQFPNPLPLAHRYRTIIPRGWRALTGATFVGTKVSDWETERPELLEVSPSGVEWDLREPVLLRFNQEVALGSIAGALQLLEQGTGTHSPGEIGDVESLGEGVYKVELKGLSPDIRYQVKVVEGLKATAGPLEGRGGESFPLEASIPKFLASTEQRASHGFLSLKFSQPVEAAEIRRHLKGVDVSKIHLTSPDDLTYRLTWPGLANLKQKKSLTLLPSLRSKAGQSFGQRVRISVLPPELAPVLKRKRSLLALAPKVTVLSRKIKKGSRVATWALSRSQLVKLLKMEDKAWSAPQKIPLEMSAPLYGNSPKKDLAATRFLAKDSSGKLNFFLVRVVDPEGSVQRTLVSRTAQQLESWYVNDEVAALVPFGAKAELLDAEGQVLAVSPANEAGRANFAGPWTEQPAFLSTRLKGDVALHSLSQVRAPLPHQVPGLLLSSRAIYGQSEVLSYLGLWWAREAQGEVVLRDQDGVARRPESHFVESVGPFLVGRLTTPEQPGAYLLDFESIPHSGAGLPFLVSALPLDSLSKASIVLDESSPGQVLTGHYAWLGPGESDLLLHARVKPLVQERDGWRSMMPGQANWIDVPLELHHDFLKTSFTLNPLPELSGAWLLEIELLDASCPDLVVGRVTKELGVAPLSLLSAQSKEMSLQDSLSKFRFEFPDGKEDGKVTCRLFRESENQLAPWSVEEEGEAEWRDGAYEWGVGLFQEGRYRLECLWETDDGQSVSANFERVVSRNQVEDWAPLAVQTLDDSPLGNLDVTWPEIPDGVRVWLSVLSADGIVSSSRSLSADQKVGTASRPSPHPGETEQILLAGWRESEDSSYQLRALRIPANSEFALRDPVVSADETEFFAEAEPKVEGRLTIPVSEWARRELKSTIIWWRPALESEASDSPVALSSDRTSLHREKSLSWSEFPVLGPLTLEDRESLEIDTPDVAGHFELCLLGIAADASYTFQVKPLEVTRGARWEPLVPPVFRPKDEFSAGLRFWPDPSELTPTGVTGSVSLSSTLLPQTYFSTANLVDPDSHGDLLFFYQAPDFVAASNGKDFRLEWELGVEGDAVPVKVDLNSLPTTTVDSLIRESTLRVGRTARFNLTSLEYWKLRLSSQQDLDEKQDSVITVDGLGSEVEEVQLSRSESSFEHFGQNETVLEIRQDRGPEVRVELYQMKPTESEKARKSPGLYLLRRLEDAEGDIEIDKLTTDLDYRIGFHLVLPEAKEALLLESPLPGGLVATGCWLLESGELIPLSWAAGRGAIQIEVPELEAGEHVIKVAVRGVVPGRFEWPGAQVTSLEGILEAQVPSSEVLVVEP